MVMEFWDLMLASSILVISHYFIYVMMTRKKPVDLEGRHVVVTGGSQGIGKEVALSCVRRGAHVTIISRNVEKLKEAHAEMEKTRRDKYQRLKYISLDVCSNYELIESTLNSLEDPIFMLVNCAGSAICGRFEEISIADARKMMDLNYFGSYYPTRVVLKQMKEKYEGIIVFTASQAALIGIYGYAPYAASKFALRGLAETVAMEVKPFGIEVTLALPSDTDTPGFEQENLSKPEETKIISGSGGLAKPSAVGEKIVKDALNGSFFSILGFESWILSVLCVGMSPWKGGLLSILQVILMGPLRLVGFFIQWNFQRIVQKLHEQREEGLIN